MNNWWVCILAFQAYWFGFYYLTRKLDPMKLAWPLRVALFVGLMAAMGLVSLTIPDEVIRRAMR